MNFKKIICGVLLTIVVSVLGISSVSAANKINIIQPNAGPINVTAGSSFTRKIITVDEATGEMVGELKFINSKSTEVIFVIDDSTIITATQKAAFTDFVTEASDLLDTYNNTTFGLYTIHPYDTAAAEYENEIVELTDEKNDMLAGINTVSTGAGKSGQDIVRSLTAVNDAFSAGAENKIVFLLLSGFDTTNIADYAAALEVLDDEDVKIVTVLLDFKNDTANETAISQLFGSETEPYIGSFYNVSSNLTAVEENLIDEITDTYPTDKSNITVLETFNAEVYNNYDLTIIDGYDGVVNGVNSNTGDFTWVINTINNSDAKITYKLEMKNALTNVEYNRDYNINGNLTISIGSTFEQAYDNSPIFNYVDPVANPKTGTIDLIVSFLAFTGIGLVTFVYVKRKDKLVQI